jgi:hypothetical protein
MHFFITCSTKHQLSSITKFSYFSVLLACWPLVPKFVGSNLAEAIGLFWVKNPQHAFLWKGIKAVCPMS